MRAAWHQSCAAPATVDGVDLPPYPTGLHTGKGASEPGDRHHEPGDLPSFPDFAVRRGARRVTVHACASMQGVAGRLVPAIAFVPCFARSDGSGPGSLMDEQTDFHEKGPARHAPVLHVCLTCRDGGEVLHDALKAQAEGSGVVVEGVRCLAACQHGCTATLSMPGKWSWLLGRLAPALAEDLLLYAKAYEQSRSGTVMPSRRPESLRDIILGRFPAQNTSLSNTETPVTERLS